MPGGNLTTEMLSVVMSIKWYMHNKQLDIMGTKV